MFRRHRYHKVVCFQVIRIKLCEIFIKHIYFKSNRNCAQFLQLVKCLQTFCNMVAFHLCTDWKTVSTKSLCAFHPHTFCCNISTIYACKLIKVTHDALCIDVLANHSTALIYSLEHVFIVPVLIVCGIYYQRGFRLSRYSIFNRSKRCC